MKNRLPTSESGGNGSTAKIPSALNKRGAVTEVVVRPPNFQSAKFTIVGTAAFVQNKFSAKALEIVRATQAAGQSAKNRNKKREPKDFNALYEACQHRFADGGYGIPAPAFRSALIDSCRVAGIAMTMAKMSVFVLADGADRDDGTPLVRITKGKPHKIESLVRNDSGVIDIRARAMWDLGWEASVTLRWDADQFTATDVANLLSRAGEQVGVGEGRPYSKDSNGQGWGTFAIKA